ncbi:TBC-domain-containing protein [Coniochaeta ligniaria NRRL 30616]|uniref:TBC-domain-containing protein n=1 Tax=Coniochaeta ligniaria NRRL 30616 TaxID=1408157 RepID=A0A1J7JEB6_9PEZI|nr:TBC-domain-containing protein [Coniochaeta ligniaria NRRL 30616]
MELDHNGAENTRHAYQPPPASATMDESPRESSRARSDTAPVVDEQSQRAVDHDSLVTVRLSEPPYLHVNTSIAPNASPSRKSFHAIGYIPRDAIADDVNEEQDGTESWRKQEHNNVTIQSPTMIVSDHSRNLQDELGEDDESPDDTDSIHSTLDDTDITQQDSNDTSVTSHPRSSEETNWDQLQEIENQESKDQVSENSTAALLARLDQENNLLATNPKTVKVQVVEAQDSPRRTARPPSMAQIRQMVNGPQPPALRYSILPPPPMTDLQFYAALVKDYRQTAARLPTLLTNKIRKGVPPPLRGIVWQSMTLAQDRSLHEVYERLSGESSPYEGIIGKDLGRSFPGVDMFRDPDGEGQRNLGRVLKCFSLYDQKIGYCQGLAFLVGPLLMHMSDKEAFCVLVRLMENYDLRDCFLPDLAGLHVRIYQFRELLRQQLPVLSAHLEDLQVDPAYVSQWFLSFFAVTCPLPMLFRIYDVIFAEGASETIMRVALSLLHKNQDRILACTELENVVQLLLSRSLWGCYNYNADELVEHFVSLSDLITRQRLAALEQGFRESQLSNSAANIAGPGANLKGADARRALDITTAASRFLGRIWASTSSSPKLGSSASGATSPSTASSSTLTPGLTAVASRPLSMLRRTVSKQSLASTSNSMEASSNSTTSSAASVLSSASTELTSISRDSSAADDISSRQSAPAKPATGRSNANKEDERNLHNQIEDLLTALSELQRNHALLADQLQKEREERSEDKKAVRSLLDGLRNKAGTETSAASHGGANGDTITLVDSQRAPEQPSEEQLSVLLDVVDQRFGDDHDNRRSSIPQTKHQLRDELARAKEQLSNELSKSQQYNQRIYQLEQEFSSVSDQLRESRNHVRSLHQEKQRLEKQIHGMRVRASDSTPTTGAENGGWFSQATGIGAAGASTAAAPGGLRELKLGRSKSTPSQSTSPPSKRASSLMLHKPANGSRESLVPAPLTAPVSEHDSLLLELVQAKTSEAIARQEAEEMKQKLESLRKAFGLAPGDVSSFIAHNKNNSVSSATTAGQATAAAASAAIGGMFGRLTGSGIADGRAAAAAATMPNRPVLVSAATTPAPAATTGGFWGWKR